MITAPPHLLPMASHGCSCCGPASHADTASIPAASDSSAGGFSSSYQVTGLTCGHCAKSVTQALQALPRSTTSRLISLLVVFPPSRSPVSYLRRRFAGLSRRPATPSYPDRFTHHLDPDRVERKERHEHSPPFRRSPW